MTKFKNFIKREEFNQIQTELQKAGIEKSKCAFNAFSLSSYNTHYENFHSDIIKSILDPFGNHGEGNLFLELFIEYLNSFKECELNIADFIDSQVERENGKIDVGIRNRESKKAIIIENKINNAADMDNQLLRYYNHCKHDGLEVTLIIYLSMDGLKKAPLFEAIKCPHINLAAYNNNPKDLTKGWLDKCIEKSLNPNSQSLLKEYSKLLQYLNGHAMENNASEMFYKIINEDDGLNTVNNILQLYSGLTRFRIDKFVDSIDKDFMPFTKQYRYKSDSYHLYEHYIDGDSDFKLDVWFEQDGTANIAFWDAKMENRKEECRIFVANKLESIGVLDKFIISPYGANGYQKSFTLIEYGTMQKIDDAIFDFVIKLFKALRDS